MDEFSPRLRDGVDVISSVTNLCRALSISEAELHEVLQLDTVSRYSVIKLPKPDGGIRTVYDPHPKLRRIQRRVKSRILSNILYPRYLYGSLSDSEFPRDYVRCASIHCPSKTIAKIDIEKFFDSIDRDLVQRVFIEVFKYPLAVSDVLSDLCTRDGVVPQGASTSSFIANLCLLGEGDIYRKLSYRKIRYTRLVDDITLSVMVVDYDFTASLKMVINFLESFDFVIHQKNRGSDGFYRTSCRPWSASRCISSAVSSARSQAYSGRS